MTPVADGAPRAAAGGTATAVVLTPTERLARSRERLRSAMLEFTSGSAQSPDRGTTGPGWLRHLDSIPGASVVIDAVRTWWMRHPARVATLVASSAARSVLHPVAERHPLAVVAGAALLGAALVATRPWRWIPKRALFAGLSLEVFHAALAHLPLDTWIAAVSSLVGSTAAPSPADPGDHDASGPSSAQAQASPR